MRTDKPLSIATSLENYRKTISQRQKYIKNEFQSYALDLARELDDWKHKSIYLRLAKNQPRAILEQARCFVKDQSPGTIKSKGRLFMWKLKQLTQKEL